MRFIAVLLAIALVGCDGAIPSTPPAQLKKTIQTSVESDSSAWNTHIVYFSEFHSEIPYQLKYSDSMHYSITLNDIDEMIDYRMTELRTNRVIDTVFTFPSPSGKLYLRLAVINCPMNGQIRSTIDLWKDTDEIVE